MVWPLKSAELDVPDFGQCLTRLSQALSELRDMTRSADFGDPLEVAQYQANIVDIKRYYEALEGLICGPQ